MVSSILLWRTNNNDLERRMGDIRLGKEENGIWARYLGGKNELDKKNASFKQTYNIAQVGYDKKKETGQSARPWTTEQEKTPMPMEQGKKTGKFGIVRSHAERRRTVP